MSATDPPAAGEPEIAGDMPSAASFDEGLTQAAGEVKALVPKCKDAVAAGGN